MNCTLKMFEYYDESITRLEVLYISHTLSPFHHDRKCYAIFAANRSRKSFLARNSSAMAAIRIALGTTQTKPSPAPVSD